MKPEKTPGLALLIGQMKPKSAKLPVESTKEKDEVEPEVDEDGQLVAMEELMVAIKEDNKKAALEAFKSLFQLLELEPHDESEHE
jgi:hypothetical protein